jgi:hypothetical protein
VAVVRHFAAVKDGVVVASRSTLRVYPFAVLHRGGAGWFASFHATREGAERAFAVWRESAPQKELVETVETPERVRPGAPAPAEWFRQAYALEEQQTGVVWK